jgi:hypothetical protein
VVDKVAVGQVSSEHLSLPCQFYFTNFSEYINHKDGKFKTTLKASARKFCFSFTFPIIFF